MLNAYGHVFGHHGFGTFTRNFYRAIDKLTPVCLVPLTSNVFFGDAVSPELQRMLDRQNEMSFKDPSLMHSVFSDLPLMNGGHLIGYPPFEATKIPKIGKNFLRQMDTVWTSCKWAKEILVDNGIREEIIYIVPGGVDPHTFFPAPATQKADSFTFISVGKWERRKGQEELLRAWTEVFDENDDVELIAHWGWHKTVSHLSVEEEIRKLNLPYLPKIKFIRGDMSISEMVALYNKADCFILPTRGEFWGLPLLEAMACGTPLLTTAYSGILEYANSENAYLIPVKRMAEVNDQKWFSGDDFGAWAEVDFEALKDLMRHAYTHRDEVAQKGKLASQHVRQNWTWDEAAKKAKQALALSVPGYF